jgi:sulfur carrier protein
MTGIVERPGAITVTEAGTVASLLRRHGIDPEARYLAVAVNGVVVRRRAWEDHLTAVGDVVEVVRPFQGG